MNKKIATLLGLAIGDAMGGPYEFLHNQNYKVPPNYVSGGIFNLSKSEYTDDTSMALCLVKSLIEKKILTQLTKWINI